MKKILLTGCAAVMISIAGMAQQKPIESSDYTKNKIKQAADSTYHDADTTLNQGVERAGQRLENQADKTGNDIRQGAEKIDQGVERTGDQLREGAQKIGTETKEGVQRAGQEVEQAGDRAMNETDTTGTGATSSGENKNDSQQAVNETESGEPQPKAYHDVTVMEDKEGPNGEVVYKFNEGYYYVDRAREKKLVKIEESDLKDIKHKIIVKTGGKKSGKSSKSSSTMKSKG
jgi:hypothetical protein